MHPIPTPSALRPFAIARREALAHGPEDAALLAVGLPPGSGSPPRWDSPEAVAAVLGDAASTAAERCGEGAVLRLFTEYRATGPGSSERIVLTTFVTEHTEPVTAVFLAPATRPDHGRAGWLRDAVTATLAGLRARRPDLQLSASGPLRPAASAGLPVTAEPAEGTATAPTLRADLRRVAISLGREAYARELAALSAPGGSRRFVIASDASVPRGAASRAVPSCAAWVDERGHGGVRVLHAGAGTGVAELAAIAAAVRAVPEARQLAGAGVTVLTDSMEALDAIRTGRAAGHESSVTGGRRHWLGAILRQLRRYDVPVEFRHVHGHRGHPLNEAADGIARAARLAEIPGSWQSGRRTLNDLERRLARRGAAEYEALRI
ncbi:MAG: RNase H family protein [Microbacteriaceae bacterium]